MQDDDKQQSYERFDETGPERNRRTFFDWLRGKEETDEEKLRKKLDEELKEAARKRAEQFEEERRVEEEREVAETRKLKKRWRAKLVEKSKQLLDEAAERGDEPVNGYEIARLMVAERIVKLHDMLQDESLDLRQSEMKSLKIHIDFMGLLSEKLDRPDLEVPEEVEQLYQTIAASVEETTGETPPEPTDETPETVPISPEDATYTAFATSIVRAIRRALQPPETSSGGEGGAGAERTENTRETTSRPAEREPRPERTREQPAPRPRVTEQLLSIVKGAALSSETIRKELSHAEQARRLADVVERAAMTNRYPAYEALKPAAIVVNPPVIAPVSSERPAEAVPEKRYVVPEKKIKFMSETQLLALARTVEIGNGRLLSDVYKKGELDREGLIKVLESRRKGLDYRREFISRREKWRRKRISQEHLAQPAAVQTGDAGAPVPPPAQVVPESSKERSKAFGRQMLSLPSLPKMPGKLRSIGRQPDQAARPSAKPRTTEVERSNLIKNVQERLKRERQIVVLFTSIVLVVILLLVVIELSSL